MEDGTVIQDLDIFRDRIVLWLRRRGVPGIAVLPLSGDHRNPRPYSAVIYGAHTAPNIELLKPAWTSVGHRSEELDAVLELDSTFMLRNTILHGSTEAEQRSCRIQNCCLQRRYSAGFATAARRPAGVGDGRDARAKPRVRGADPALQLVIPGASGHYVQLQVSQLQTTQQSMCFQLFCCMCSLVVDWISLVEYGAQL